MTLRSTRMMIDAAFFLCPVGMGVSEWRSEGGRGVSRGRCGRLLAAEGGVQRILASPFWSRVTAAQRPKRIFVLYLVPRYGHAAAGLNFWLGPGYFGPLLRCLQNNFPVSTF